MLIINNLNLIDLKVDNINFYAKDLNYYMFLNYFEPYKFIFINFNRTPIVTHIKSISYENINTK